jgi:hypothetical protein
VRKKFLSKLGTTAFARTLTQLMRDGSDSPYYEVCCRYGSHGPCAAVVIGELGGQWKDFTDKFGLFGFDETCAGLIVLSDTHAGLHDLCLPTQCSEMVNNHCVPTKLEFDGSRYEPAHGLRKASDR